VFVTHDQVEAMTMADRIVVLKAGVVQQFGTPEEVYKTPANPNGLDSAKWKATEAEFHADILFETQGQTDYRVDSRENFIVIQDLDKSAGAPRRFLIYRWEDLDPPPVPAQETAILTEHTAWSGVKSLYR